MRKIKLLFILLLLSFSSFSQDVIRMSNDIENNTDEQLAAQYFQNKEFEKAALYYEKLFAKKPIDFYYKNLLECYLETEKFKDAEKLVKTQLRKSNNAFTYKVDLGYVQKKAGNNDKAQKEFKQAINDLIPITNAVFELANAFFNRKEVDLALETYYKGRKIVKGDYGFHFEIASLLATKGDFIGMINEYLDVLEINPVMINQVQNNLATFYQNPEDERIETIKNELLRRIQKSPDSVILSELLIWFYLQQKDFSGAFIQSKALDKKLKEDGSRIFNLAEMSANNQDYRTATKAYEYLIQKGKEGFYYQNARVSFLNMSLKQIQEKGSHTNEEIVELEKKYIETLNELGKSPKTVSLMRELAKLNAYFLNNIDKAVDLLIEAIDLPRLGPRDQAECKIDLADIYLLTGEVWDASLMYSQVEKAFKMDETGDMAKFKNARLSYFIGEFNWAKAQLDVLKGSTSKLISNDAMKLALLIADNTTIDTNAVPMQLYAKADFLMFQKQYNNALKYLDTLQLFFKGHSLDDEALFLRATIAEKKNDFTKAAEIYQNILDAYGYDVLADDALFNLAEINELEFKNIEKAKELYQKLLTDFPASLYTVEARKRFRTLRGDKLN